MALITRKELMLVLLAMAHPRNLMPVQLQKIVFLAQKGLEEGKWKDVLTEPYDFKPYDYGPFCKDVYEDVRRLCENNEAIIEGRQVTPYRTYGISEQGLLHAQQIEARLPTKINEHFRYLTDWVLKQSFGSLVGAIYQQYPEMATNSVFVG